MKTEAEAKLSICPLTLSPIDVTNHGAVGGRAGHLRPSPRHCIASECMAWRRSVEKFDPNTGKAVQPGQMVIQSGRGIITIPERPSATHGFCGLAGKP